MDQFLKLVAFLGLMCIARVVADDCAPFVDANFQPHRPQACVLLSSCAGSCMNRYCDIIPGTALDQSQFMCIVTNLYVVIGAGIVIFLMIVGAVISCICKSLCWCCSLCRRQPRAARLTTTVAVANLVPQQPLIAYPSASGYQPVPNSTIYQAQSDKAYLPPPYPGAENFAYVDSP